MQRCKDLKMQRSGDLAEDLTQPRSAKAKIKDLLRF
jgi:hypothetical protein